MKNGGCPKCGSKDVRKEESQMNGRNSMGLGWWQGFAKIINYVCPSCGYLESYIHPEDLEAVARKLPRAEASDVEV